MAEIQIAYKNNTITANLTRQEEKGLGGLTLWKVWALTVPVTNSVAKKNNFFTSVIYEKFGRYFFTSFPLFFKKEMKARFFVCVNNVILRKFTCNTPR